MEFSPLTDADLAELDEDREFVPTVLEACFPGRHLLGTAADLAILQQVFEGGPYTDSPAAELIALGTALGDLLGRELAMEWVCFSDEAGRTLAMRYAHSSIVIFPRDMIIKRAERGEEGVELLVIYEGVIEAVRKMIDSGEYS